MNTRVINIYDQTICNKRERTMNQIKHLLFWCLQTCWNWYPHWMSLFVLTQYVKSSNTICIRSPWLINNHNESRPHWVSGGYSTLHSAPDLLFELNVTFCSECRYMADHEICGLRVSGKQCIRVGWPVVVHEYSGRKCPAESRCNAKCWSQIWLSYGGICSLGQH